MEKSEIGHVTHYFDDIHVATIQLNAPLHLGDRIWFGGEDNGFEQTVESLQIDDDQVEIAETNSVAGVHVDQPAEEGWVVFKL